MRKILLALVFFAIVIISLVSLFKSDIYYPTKVEELQEEYKQPEKEVVDHSKFEILDKNFESAHEVTEACVTCHNTRDQEIMQSSHWNWERPEYIEGRGIVYLGKKNAVNNFCIGTQTNEQACAKCHIGFGMSEEGFSFTDKKNIDCMVCHDNSRTYVKATNKAGYPDPALNLNEIAKDIGKPTRDNCGVCHFFGGGGNNVKHGDLDKAMFNPSRDIDVHMAVEGANLVCTDCHETENHQMSGKLYSLSSMNVNRTTCEQCHTESPHADGILNEHTIKVSCQTCHIPKYAKANSTKLHWDWSTAGKLKDGEPYTVKDSLGNPVYKSIKGSFEWGRNLTPEYQWFNGTARHYVLGDKIEDTSKALVLNELNGSYSNYNSKIIPVKVHKAKQIYDPVNRILIQPHLYDDEEGEGAFWVDFNWQEAAEVGMERIELPYSGEYSFIETEMNWPINHMVAPKEESLSCNSCHTRENSRLANLTNFYMPGRDYNASIEFLGKGIVILTLIGVFVHGTVRIFASKKSKKAGN
jgi:octaheme c-type cytochrome (tetrathionate reductase family)